MKRIIALWHSGNKGKTRTLIELGNLLLSDESCIIVESLVGKNDKLPENKDFILIVKLYDKVIVGIDSVGDPGCNLKNRLKEMIDKHNVEYLFCATRTRGETVSDVYDISNARDYEILWTSTYHSDSETDIDFFNKLKAKHLFDLLIELINQTK
ncbi:MAG: hypothetical protein LBR10_07215 [Prevotellaceae bacterium]|jgi:hypothetical protein|nr:hypothetical protein [Prevotellaceae bacterium]